MVTRYYSYFDRYQLMNSIGFTTDIYLRSINTPFDRNGCLQGRGSRCNKMYGFPDLIKPKRLFYSRIIF